MNSGISQYYDTTRAETELDVWMARREQKTKKNTILSRLRSWVRSCLRIHPKEVITGTRLPEQQELNRNTMAFKTREEWFRMIPNEDCINRAIANVMKSGEAAGKTKLAQRCASFREALNMGFTWAGTPEGDEFWRNIHDKSDIR